MQKSGWLHIYKKTKRKSGEARDRKSIGTCKTGKSNLRGDWNVGEK